MEFETVNGSVKVEAPSNLAPDVLMATVNGSLRSDLPLTMQGRITKNRIHGTVNGGGRRLSLKTVNGSIELTDVVSEPSGIASLALVHAYRAAGAVLCRQTTPAIAIIRACGARTTHRSTFCRFTRFT